MSTPTMVPMLDPQGNPGDIPQEHVSEAVGKGFKIGQELTDPSSGKVGVVPLERVHDAIRAGFQMKGASPSAPKADMQTAGLGTDTSTVPNPKAAVAMAGDDPSGKTGEAISGLALGGAAATGVASAGGAVLPAVLPHTIEGVKAIGSWATKNPLQAYLLYNIMKEMLPGAKKAIGVIKEAPE